MNRYTIRDRALAQRIGDMIAGLSFEKHAWDVTIKRHQKQRTSPQNNMYWKWLEIIGNEIGYEKDELHDVLREKFLPWEEVVVLGIRRKVLTRTSDPEFSTQAMSEYMDRIERFAAQELGLLLPRPDDQWHEIQARAR